MNSQFKLATIGIKDVFSFIQGALFLSRFFIHKEYFNYAFPRPLINFSMELQTGNDSCKCYVTAYN